MTKQPRVLHWVLLAVVATGAGTWWLTSRDPSPAPSAPATASPTAATAPARTTTEELPVALQPQQDLAPMPPSDLPLRDAFASLRSRADAGDSMAACRLGMQLLRCAQLDGYPEGHDAAMVHYQAEFETAGKLGDASRIALGRKLHADLREECLGIPDEMVARANHYMRQAALAGQPEAMLRYAAGESLTPGQMYMNHFTTPEFDVWRREARTLLMRAIEAGHPEAALLLAEAHANEVHLLSMLLPRDHVEAMASLTLARRLFGDDPALARLAGRPNLPTVPPLDAESAAEAERRAADWHDRSFMGRRLVLANSTAALLPVYRRVDWEPEDVRWPVTASAVPCDASRGMAP